MALTIMAWNLRDAFSHPEGNFQAVQNQIFELNPDVGVFPEARTEGLQLAASVRDEFMAHGYETYECDYDDDDTRKDRHGLLVIAKSELIREEKVVRLAGRSALLLSLHDDIDFLGVHLVDRTPIDNQRSNGGEAQRVAQTKAALALLARTPLNPAIVAGDFNAMHASSLAAKAVRILRPVIDRLPSVEPEPGVKYKKIERIGSLSQRLTDMALGETLTVWERAGFVDADPDHKPTMSKGPLRFQLDHILARKMDIIGSDTVTPPPQLSDHKILTASMQT